MDKSTMIDRIVETEWKMFQSTRNIGGRAWCQDDRAQFEANRQAQFENWNAECLQSYSSDLEAAEQNGENLVAYKYGYMMEDTAPEEYQKIKSSLPERTEEKLQLVRRLTGYVVRWGEAFAGKYPEVAHRGRPVRAVTGSAVTSVETYAAGELSTYSMPTLQKLLHLYEIYRADGINLHERIVANELERTLHLPLEELEKRLSNQGK